MNRPPAYPAARAANVMLVVAIFGAIALAAAGYTLRREGSPLAWVLFAFAFAGIVAAIMIRRSVNRPRE